MLIRRPRRGIRSLWDLRSCPSDLVTLTRRRVRSESWPTREECRCPRIPSVSRRTGVPEAHRRSPPRVPVPFGEPAYHRRRSRSPRSEKREPKGSGNLGKRRAAGAPRNVCETRDTGIRGRVTRCCASESGRRHQHIVDHVNVAVHRLDRLDDVRAVHLDPAGRILRDLELRAELVHERTGHETVRRD